MFNKKFGQFIKVLTKQGNLLSRGFTHCWKALVELYVMKLFLRAFEIKKI
jgi:hypothetical protein